MNMNIETVDDAIEYVLTLDLFSYQDRISAIPIPNHWNKSDSKLYLVLGSNGSGKSFFRRLVKQVLIDTSPIVEVFDLSMERRTGWEQHRTLVFGHEDKWSTGLNSADTVVKGIRTCQLRERPHAIIMDEPDIGMDDCSAAGMGEFLAEWISDMNPLTKAVFISSHSKELVKRLQPLNPQYIHLGSVDCPPTLEEWLERKVEPRTPEQLRQTCVHRYKLIDQVMNPILEEAYEKSEEVDSRDDLR